MATLLALTSVVSGRSIYYDFVLNSAVSTFSGNVKVVYSADVRNQDGEDMTSEEFSHWFPISGVTHVGAQENDHYLVRGRVDIPARVTGVLSETLSTNVSARLLSLDVDGAQIQTDLNDTVQSGTNVSKSSSRLKDPSFVVAAGSSFVFDGPVYENLGVATYNTLSEEYVADQIVRNSFTVAQPCRVVEDIIVIPGYEYSLGLIFPSYLRSEASETVRSAISASGYTTPEDAGEIEVFESYPQGLATRSSGTLGMSTQSFTVAGYFMESYDDTIEAVVEPVDEASYRVIKETEAGGEDLPYFYVEAN